MFFKDENTNKMIISIIWGLGIAALFRKLCDENKCIEIKAPVDINNYILTKNKKCYEFSKEKTDCK